MTTPSETIPQLIARWRERANEAERLSGVADEPTDVSAWESIRTTLNNCADELEAAAALRVPPDRQQEWADALERTRNYIRTAMTPISVKEACGEGIYDRAHRAGLKHALNAINAEFAKVEEAAAETAHEPPNS